MISGLNSVATASADAPSSASPATSKPASSSSARAAARKRAWSSTINTVRLTRELSQRQVVRASGRSLSSEAAWRADRRPLRGTVLAELRLFLSSDLPHVRRPPEPDGFLLYPTKKVYDGRGPEDQPRLAVRAYPKKRPKPTPRSAPLSRKWRRRESNPRKGSSGTHPPSRVSSLRLRWDEHG